MKIDSKQFFEEGFAGPLQLFSRKECEEAVLRRFNMVNRPVWEKAIALSNSHFYQLATRPDILILLRELLGDDILLWGSRLVQKGPGVEHPWHSDMECCGETGRTVTLWTGLENTNQKSSLHVVTFSHHFRESLQEIAYRCGKKRTEVTTDDVLQWAHERDPRSRLIQFDLRDGDALFLNGKLWHYSKNTSTSDTRTALLLQYSTPDAEIRMPHKKEYEWPFRFSEERPPCVVISGADHSGVNHIVPPPALDSIFPCFIRSIDSLHFKWKKEGWRSGTVFKSLPNSPLRLNCHVSTLSEGATPHEPHSHEEEELLIVLSGQVEIIRVDNTGQRTSEGLNAGSFVYHSAYQSHTLYSAGPGPAKYLMFKWKKGEPGSVKEQILKSGTFNIWNGKEKNRDGWKRIVNLQSPTFFLDKLNVHLSILEPGAGYQPHRDPYDVAIITLSGQVETLDFLVAPHNVIYYPANELHGMKNPGDEKAIYLVFEFHGNQSLAGAGAHYTETARK